MIAIISPAAPIRIDPIRTQAGNTFVSSYGGLLFIYLDFRLSSSPRSNCLAIIKSGSLRWWPKYSASSICFSSFVIVFADVFVYSLNHLCFLYFKRFFYFIQLILFAEIESLRINVVNKLLMG